MLYFLFNIKRQGVVKLPEFKLQVMNIYLRSKIYLKTLVGHQFPETGLAGKKTDNMVD